jgi:hypothetical protein
MKFSTKTTVTGAIEMTTYIPRQWDRVRVIGVSRTGQHVNLCLGTMLSSRSCMMYDEILLDGLGRHQFNHTLWDYNVVPAGPHDM